MRGLNAKLGTHRRAQAVIRARSRACRESITAAVGSAFRPAAARAWARR